MSHCPDHLNFFKRAEFGFSDGHGMVTSEDRTRENGYRNSWQRDTGRHRQVRNRACITRLVGLFLIGARVRPGTGITSARTRPA